MHGDATTSNATDGNSVPADDQIAYTVPHAARVLDVSPRTAWQLVHTGQLSSFKIGRSRRVTREALVSYVRSQQVAAA